MSRPRDASTASLAVHCTASALLIAAVFAQAQAVETRGPIVSFIPGECRALVIAGRVATDSCKPQLIGISYPNREISFVFSLSGRQLVSFKGRPGDVRGSQTTLEVGQVTVASPQFSRAAAAVGSCVFTGIAPGRNRLDCDVSINGARYSGEFLTSAQHPVRWSL